MTSRRKPLEKRDGYEEDDSHPLVSALHDLAKAHGLQGCVLVSFYGDRVGVNSHGESTLWGSAMDELASRILGKIDDGEFDPTVHLS